MEDILYTIKFVEFLVIFGFPLAILGTILVAGLQEIVRDKGR